MTVIAPWCTSHDGNFAEAFIKRCLTPIEMGELLKQPLPQSIGPDSNHFEDLSRQENDVSMVRGDIRKTLVDIVLTWTDIYAGGVILKSTNDATKLFLVFEFISQHKRVTATSHHFDERNKNKNMNMNMNCIDPIVFVSYATSPTMEQAELLLRDEDVDLITCSDQVLLELSQLFRESFPNSGLIDIMSRLAVKEGYLEPIHPPSPPPPPVYLSISPRVGESVDVNNGEEEEECEDEDEDDFNDSFEFEDEISASSDLGYYIHESNIKQELKTAKESNGIWGSKFFIITIACITAALLYLFHEEDTIQKVFRVSKATFNYFNRQWIDIEFQTFDFSLDFSDLTMANLVGEFYNLTTNNALTSV